MNTQIPDDPFSGIQIPQLKQVTQLGDTLGEQSVAVQVDVNQTQQPYFSGSDKTTKRPMKPPPDTIGTQGQDEPQTSEGAAIDVVGSDGKLNKVPKHSTWVTPTNYPISLKTVNSGNSVTIDNYGLEVSNGTYTAKILFTELASFAKNLSLRELTICDAGVSKKILILASAPYT